MVDEEGTVRRVIECSCFHSPDTVRALGHAANLLTALDVGDMDAVARHAHAILALVEKRPVARVVNLGARRKEAPRVCHGCVVIARYGDHSHPHDPWCARRKLPPPFDLALDELADGEGPDAG